MSNETVDVTITTGTMIITDVAPPQVVVGSSETITYYGVNLGLVENACFKDSKGNTTSMQANSAGGGRKATCQAPTGTVAAGTTGTTWLEGPGGHQSNTLPIDFITA